MLAELLSFVQDYITPFMKIDSTTTLFDVRKKTFHTLRDGQYHMWADSVWTSEDGIRVQVYGHLRDTKQFVDRSLDGCMRV